MEAPNPLSRVTFRGKTMDRKTAAALAVAEHRLGYELTVVQGAYNVGVGASAGTHDRGGVVDLAPFDHGRKVEVLRRIGFAAWYRPAIPGLWGAHIHAVMLGHQDLAPAAAAQVTAYRQGLDGLAGGRKDPNPFRPKPEPHFDYADHWRDDMLRQRIKGWKAQIGRLRDRISAARNRIHD